MFISLNNQTNITQIFHLVTSTLLIYVPSEKEIKSYKIIQPSKTRVHAFKHLIIDNIPNYPSFEGGLVA